MAGIFDWRMFDDVPDEGTPFVAARHIGDFEWGFDLLYRAGDDYWMRDHKIEGFDYAYWTYIEPPYPLTGFKPYLVK